MLDHDMLNVYLTDLCTYTFFLDINFQIYMLYVAYSHMLIFIEASGKHLQSLFAIIAHTGIFPPYIFHLCYRYKIILMISFRTKHFGLLFIMYSTMYRGHQVNFTRFRNHGSLRGKRLASLISWNWVCWHRLVGDSWVIHGYVWWINWVYYHRQLRRFHVGCAPNLAIGSIISVYFFN